MTNQATIRNALLALTVAAVALGVTQSAHATTLPARAPVARHIPGTNPSTPVVHHRPATQMQSVNAFLASVPGDGGSSVQLPDGRILWMFGDTFDAQGGHNTIALQSGETFTRIPGEFKRTTVDGHWFWPGQPVIDGGRLVIVWGEIQADSGWGTQVATVVDTYSTLSLRQLSETRVASSTAWGTGIVRQGGKWWILGTRAVSTSDMRKQLFVRTTTDLGDVSSWSAPTMVLSQSWGGVGVGTTVSIVATASGVEFATKLGDLLSTSIVTATASTPAGPWTAPRVALTPAPPYSGAWTYATYLHPEQPHGAGKMLLTYAVNSNVANPANHLYAVQCPM